MGTSQQAKSYQVQIGLTDGQLDGEMGDVCTLCDDLQSIHGTVRILLALCKGGRKIDPVNLSGLLQMLDEKLDGTEDLANGLRKLIECLTPTAALRQGADGNGNAGLHLVPVTSTHES
ncbi:MAG: hypothetical protein HRU82_11830 [Nitrospira sp.]|nr:MAG: hypothetical protein HRU82_11830 [Nitrospira sp.]